jgi:hypothetical protein
MQKQANFGIYSNPVADAALAASRQVWLAGLGAAAYTREWARSEAGKTFRALVKEGSAVESQAIRVLSKRVQNSVTTATSLLRQTRATVMSTAGALAQNASDALTRFKAPVTKPSAPAKARKAVKASAKRAARSTRRRIKHTARAARKA